MEDKNKIDQFFSNVFEDLSSEQPDWLTPPEDVWEAAKMHFPKRKKKDRKFFWLFSGLLTTAFFAVLLGYNYHTLLNAPNDILPSTSSYATNEIKQTDDNLTSKSLEEAVEDTEEDAAAYAEKGDQLDNRIEVIIAADTEALASSSTSSISSPQKGKIETRVKPNTRGKSSKISTALQYDNSESSTPISISSLPETVAVNSVTLPKRELDMAKLTSINLPQEIFSLEEGEMVMSPMMVIPIRTVPSIPRYEFGLTYRQMAISLVDLIGEPDGPMDQIQFAQRYVNTNLDFRRWINRKWSLQTGLWFSRLDFDLQFSIISLVDRDAREFLAKELTGYTVSTEKRNIDELSALTLKEGTTLNIGDSINVRSNLGIDFTVLQIPFMIDYHMRRGNWEFLVGGGFTVDLYRARQTAYDLEVYKGGSLVNEQFRFEKLTESGVDFSVYSNMGFRYRISPHLHLGMTARIMITEPIFSGLEAGLYYRL